jgi:pyruvate formate lyase activating enzyme
MVADEEPRATITVTVDGRSVSVPERITVKRALEAALYWAVQHSVGVGWGEGDVPAPCGTGGCYTCVVLAEGQVVRACVTPVRAGMAIETELPADYAPRRIVHGPQAHTVGGKATPWWLKGERRYISNSQFDLRSTMGVRPTQVHQS